MAPLQPLRHGPYGMTISSLEALRGMLEELEVELNDCLFITLDRNSLRHAISRIVPVSQEGLDLWRDVDLIDRCIWESDVPLLYYEPAFRRAPLNINVLVERLRVEARNREARRSLRRRALQMLRRRLRGGGALTNDSAG